MSSIEHVAGIKEMRLVGLVLGGQHGLALSGVKVVPIPEPYQSVYARVSDPSSPGRSTVKVQVE